MKPEQMTRTWSAEEMAALRELVEGGYGIGQMMDRLPGRSRNAIQLRRQRFFPREFDPSVSPGWGRGKAPGGKYWTPERIEAGLRDFMARHQGQLPSSDHIYNDLKKGHMEWPTARSVLELWPSMSEAWDAIGAPRSRVSRLYAPWSQEDDDFLLDSAGTYTLKLIARRLGRSWPACKRRLYDLKAGRARDVSGFMSAMQVAKEYGCPLHRVSDLIARGELPAKKVLGGHYWRIDPADAEALAGKLRAPKRTYRKRPADFGDYERRYGLRRVSINGRIVRVAV